MRYYLISYSICHTGASAAQQHGRGVLIYRPALYLPQKAIDEWHVLLLR